MAANSVGTPPVSSQEIPSLFVRYGLGTVFSHSAEEYKKNLEKSKSDRAFKKLFSDCILHHLYACGSHGTIRSYLEKKTSQQVVILVNMKDPTYQMSPLHVTVIKGDIKGTQELIDRGADPLDQDQYGFTPWMHTALLTDCEGIKNLLSSQGGGGDLYLWKQLRKSAGLESCNQSIRKCSYVKENGEKAPLTIDVWKNAFGMEDYTDATLFFPEDHRHLWRLFNKHSFCDPQQLRSMLPKVESVSSLAIKNSVIETASTALSNRGLYTTERLAQGAFIGWYGAKVTQRPHGPELYAFEHQSLFQQKILRKDNQQEYFAEIDGEEVVTGDALRVGNALRFANDGWPMMFTLQFPGPHIGMFAIQQVQEDLELTWHYGVSNPRLKWGEYRILNKQLMVDFFKNKQLQDLVKSVEEPSTLVQLYGDQARLSFIFETPLALIFLCVTNILKVNEVIQLLQNSLISDQLLDTRSMLKSPHYVWLIQTLFMLEQMERITSKENESLVKEMKAFIADELINHFSVIRVVKGIQMIRDLLEDSSPLEKKQSNFKIETKEFLKTYALETDPEPPLATFKSENELVVVDDDEISKLLKELTAFQQVINPFMKSYRQSHTTDSWRSYSVSTYKKPVTDEMFAASFN